jgi:hypothetical protein
MIMIEETGKRTAGGKILIFFLRFVLISLILYAAWLFIGRYYTLAVAWGAKPLVALTGNTLSIEQTLQVREEISLNPVVYLSLVLAVTGVSWRKRIRCALIGILILTAANIITVFFMFLSAFRGSEQLWAGTEFLNMTINFFLPIVLWVLLMPWGSLLPINLSRD